MNNYTLLFTFNKDNQTLDLLNNNTKDEIIYTAEEVKKISIDDLFEITNELAEKIKETTKFNEFPLLGYFYKKEGKVYIATAIENQMLTIVDKFNTLEDCIYNLRGECWEDWELEI